MDMVKKELAHLSKIGVLEQIGATKWGLPTFIRWMVAFAGFLTFGHAKFHDTTKRVSSPKDL